MYKVVVSVYTCNHNSSYSYTAKKFKYLKSAKNWVKKNKNRFYTIKIKEI